MTSTYPTNQRANGSFREVCRLFGLHPLAPATARPAHCHAETNTEVKSQNFRDLTHSLCTMWCTPRICTLVEPFSSLALFRTQYPEGHD